MINKKTFFIVMLFLLYCTFISLIMLSGSGCSQIVPADDTVDPLSKEVTIYYIHVLDEKNRQIDSPLLIVTGDGVELSRGSANDTHVIPSGYELYEFKVTCDGYTSTSKTFTYQQLKAFHSMTPKSMLTLTMVNLYPTFETHIQASNGKSLIGGHILITSDLTGDGAGSQVILLDDDLTDDVNSFEISEKYSIYRITITSDGYKTYVHDYSKKDLYTVWKSPLNIVMVPQYIVHVDAYTTRKNSADSEDLSCDLVVKSGSEILFQGSISNDVAEVGFSKGYDEYTFIATKDGYETYEKTYPGDTVPYYHNRTVDEYGNRTIIDLFLRDIMTFNMVVPANSDLIGADMTIQFLEEGGSEKEEFFKGVLEAGTLALTFTEDKGTFFVNIVKDYFEVISHTYTTDEMKKFDVTPLDVTLKHDTTYNYIKKIEVVGNYAFLADRGDGVRVLDISDKENSFLVTSVYSDLEDMCREGNYIYVANTFTIDIIDISVPAEPKKVSTFATELTDVYLYDIEVHNQYVYVTGINYVDGPFGYRAVYIFDVRDTSLPLMVKRTDLLISDDSKILVHNDHLFVAAFDCLAAINISDPSNAEVVYSSGSYSNIDDMVIYKDRLLAVRYGGMYLLNIDNPAETTLIDNVGEVYSGCIGVSYPKFDNVNAPYWIDTKALHVRNDIIYFYDSKFGKLAGKIFTEADSYRRLYARPLDDTQMFYTSDMVFDDHYMYQPDDTQGITITPLTNDVKKCEPISVIAGEGYSNNTIIHNGLRFNYDDYPPDKSELSIYDFSDQKNQTLVSTITFNDLKDIEVHGNYLYTLDRDTTTDGSKNRNIGLFNIYDISDPKNPAPVFNNPQIIDIINNTSFFSSMTVDAKNQRCFIAGPDYITVCDFSGMNHFDVLRYTNISAFAEYPVIDMVLHEDQVYLSSGSGVQHIDFTDYYNIAVEPNIVDVKSGSLAIYGDYLYIVTSQDGTKIVDVTDPKRPDLRSSIDTGWYGSYSNGSVYVYNDHAYISTIDLYVVNITDVNNPTLVRKMKSFFDLSFLSIIGNGDSFYGIGNGGHAVIENLF